jgi:hypothetical protein
MAERFIINATDAALAVQGETTAARTGVNSTGAPTDAESGALIDTAGVAMMAVSPTAAQQMAIAAVLIDNAVASISLTTAAKRKVFKLKKSVEEWEDILAAIPS